MQGGFLMLLHVTRIVGKLFRGWCIHQLIWAVMKLWIAALLFTVYPNYNPWKLDIDTQPFLQKLSSDRQICTKSLWETFTMLFWSYRGCRLLRFASQKHMIHHLIEPSVISLMLRIYQSGSQKLQGSLIRISQLSCSRNCTLYRFLIAFQQIPTCSSPS